MINSPICGDRLGKIVGEAVCAFLPGPVAVSRSWLGFEQCGVGYKGIGGTNQKYQKQSGDKQQACGENSHLDGPFHSISSGRTVQICRAPGDPI